MNITIEQLKQILPYSGKRADTFILPLNAAMAEFDIDNPLRQSAFIAQIGHESGSLRYVRELATGTAYEWRKDLGNTQAGDGVKFKGRGLIQITGRANYKQISEAFGIDFLELPELLETPENATRSAAWWWQTHNLNTLADQKLFDKITRVINGGTNGQEERRALYAKALEVLGVDNG